MRRVGILTPMANPTVEAELRRLLPADLDYVVARLVSPAAEPMARLADYGVRARATADQFGAMVLSAIGFACTGTSYLLEDDEAASIAASFAIPFIFAAEAVAGTLNDRGATTIALISPYPAPLHQAALRWWARQGFTIVHEAAVDIGSADTRAIYRLTGDEAAAPIAAARAAGPDAIILSGTGMPSLGQLRPDGEPPVLSTNYCLARALEAAA
jgi:maleate isomerase